MLVWFTLQLSPSHPSPLLRFSPFYLASSLCPTEGRVGTAWASSSAPDPLQMQCFSPQLLIIFVLCLEKHKVIHSLRKRKRLLITANSRNSVLKCCHSRIKISWIFSDGILTMMTPAKMVCWDRQFLSMLLKHDLKQSVSLKTDIKSLLIQNFTFPIKHYHTWKLHTLLARSRRASEESYSKPSRLRFRGFPLALSKSWKGTQFPRCTCTHARMQTSINT